MIHAGMIEIFKRKSVLYHLLEELKNSGQKTCPLYDSEARWMKNKKDKQKIKIELENVKKIYTTPISK